jgi:amino acid permease
MSSNFLTLTAMINGMIGTALLLLPHLFLKAGLLNSIIITLASCVFSYYSSRITYIHIHPK